MKKYLKLLIVVIIAAVMVLGTLLLTSCSLISDDDEISYKDVDGGKALYRYEGNSTHDTFVIPETFEDEPVVELMEFSIAASENLKYLTIGKNVKTISERAFCGSVKIVAFTVAEGNEFFETEDGILYNKGKTELVCYPNGKTPLVTDASDKAVGGGVFNIPDSVTLIRKTACYSCSNLYEVNFGKNVKTVGDNAFMKCSGLVKLNLNEGLTEISVDSFSFCDNLKEVTLPSTIEKIGDYAFFSQASKLERFQTKRAVSEISCGKNWLPTKNGLKTGEIQPEYVA